MYEWVIHTTEVPATNTDAKGEGNHICRHAFAKNTEEPKKKDKKQNIFVAFIVDADTGRVRCPPCREPGTTMIGTGPTSTSKVLRSTSSRVTF